MDTSSFTWRDDATAIDWDELSELYRRAPLGVKPPNALRTVFGNSMFTTTVSDNDRLIGVGRAVADGMDCAYIADVAVLPEYQRLGLGAAVIRRLIDLAAGHKKIILYANPGTEGFYRRLGFLPMATAMGIWADRDAAIAGGLLRDDPSTT